MFNKIKSYFIALWLQYVEMQQGIIQYRPCYQCGKKYYFKIIKCPCGNCDNETHCVCNKCDKQYDVNENNNEFATN